MHDKASHTSDKFENLASVDFNYGLCTLMSPALRPNVQGFGVGRAVMANPKT